MADVVKHKKSVQKKNHKMSTVKLWALFMDLKFKKHECIVFMTHTHTHILLSSQDICIFIICYLYFLK